MLFKLVKHVHAYGPEDLGIGDILICNDKIVEVGTDLDYRLPNQTVIDASSPG
jgi:beta-aspartyl-dipeptidase (metallo-type)